MKKHLTFFIMLESILFMPLLAQKAQIKVGYDYEVKIDGQERKEDYVLMCGKHSSMFYNPTALWMDINSKDETARQAYGKMASHLQETGRQSEIPNRAVSMYIFKDFDKEDKTVYDDYSDQFAVYNEPFAEMQWDIVGDSTKTILGYECILARLSYHGRNWKVWFTPEIPLHDGPWKFAGLPGLILLASESDGIHSFIANGIEATEQEIPSMVRADWYHKENRIKYLQGKYKHLEDPLADIAGGNLPMNVKVVVNGKETTRDELRNRTRKMIDSGYDFLETDYHKLSKSDYR